MFFLYQQTNRNTKPKYFTHTAQNYFIVFWLLYVNCEINLINY